MILLTHNWIIDNKSRILCVGIVSIRLLAALIELISINIFGTFLVAIYLDHVGGKHANPVQP